MLQIAFVLLMIYVDFIMVYLLFVYFIVFFIFYCYFFVFSNWYSFVFGYTVIFFRVFLFTEFGIHSKQRSLEKHTDFLMGARRKKLLLESRCTVLWGKNLVILVE